MSGRAYRLVLSFVNGTQHLAGASYRDEQIAKDEAARLMSGNVFFLDADIYKAEPGTVGTMYRGSDLRAITIMRYSE